MADGVPELVIRIKKEVDAAGQAAAKAAFAADRKLIAENLAAAKAAKKAEAEAVKAAAKQAIESARQVAAAVKQAEKEKAAAAKQAAKEAAEAAKQTLKEAKQSAKEQTAAAKQAAKEAAEAVRQSEKEKADAIKKGLKEATAATKQAAGEARSLERELFREGRRLAAEKAASEKQYTRDSIGLARQSAAERKKALEESAKAEEKASQARAKESAAMNKALGSAAALGVLVVGQMDTAFKKVSESALQATEKTIEYRKALIELASLRGKAGDTTPELRKNVALAAETGLSMDKVASLTTEAYAGAQGFLDQPGEAQNLMAPEEYSKLVAQTGKYAAVYGGDTGAYGRAASMIPVFAGKRITAAEGENELQRYDKLAQVAGITNPGVMFDQMKKNQGYVTSGVVSGPEMAALTAAFSKTGGAENAATSVRQALNAVSTGLMRDKGMKIDEAFADDAQTSSEYFKSAGITQQMMPIDRLEKISDDLQKQQASAKKAGKNFNADEYLLQNGIVNQESRLAFQQFAGNRPQWEKTIQPLVGAAFAPGVIDQKFDEAAASDPAIRQGMTEAAKASADVALGEKGALKEQMRRIAYESLRAKGKTMGSYEEYATPLGVTDAYNLNRIGVGGVNPRTLDDEAGRLYMEEAKKLGVPQFHAEGGRLVTIADELTKGYAGTYGLGRTPGMESDLYNDIGGRMQAAGGSPIPGVEKLAALAEAQLRATEEQTKAIREANAARKPNPLQGQAPGRPANNVGRP